MTNPQLPLNDAKNKTRRPALQSMIFGVSGVLGLAVSDVLVYAGGLIPFLILLTGLIAVPLALIAFVLGIFGIVYGVRAIRLPDESKVLAWIATLMNAVVLLIFLITVIIPILSSVIGTIAMAIHS